MKWWGQLNRIQKIRRLAHVLWRTPLIMLFPLWWFALYEPMVVLREWALYLWFFGLPFAAAVFLLVRARRMEKSEECKTGSV